MSSAPTVACPACQSQSWQPYPMEGVFACGRCMFAIDVREDFRSTQDRAKRWQVFPSTDAGLPPRFFAEAGIGPEESGTRSFLPGIDAHLREQQREAVGRDAPWVVRHFGVGKVAYHSHMGPVKDPRDAHVKSKGVALEVVAKGAWIGWALNLRQEALPQEQAIEEFDRGEGRHAPGAAKSFNWLGILLGCLAGYVLFRIFSA